MELISVSGLVVAASVILYLALRNHHEQVMGEFDELRKVLAEEVEALGDEVSDDGDEDVMRR